MTYNIAMVVLGLVLAGCSADTEIGMPRDAGDDALETGEDASTDALETAEAGQVPP